MPYARPTLTTLQQQTAQDITGDLPTAQPNLRFNNLGIVGKMLSGLINLCYGYLDWIAKMATPFGALGEYALGWGGLKGVTIKAATYAGSQGGAILFSACTPGEWIFAATPLVRGDGFEFAVVADVQVAGDGTATVLALAVNAGSLGNTAPGTTINLGVSLEGIQSSGVVSTAISGGTDDETMDAYKSRYLEVYQNPPQGGANADYTKWALEVAGVTRAWPISNGMGVGTVLVYFMMDVAEAAFGGFPQGTNGVAANEPRASAATGDQLTVANYLYGDNVTPRQPVTALVYTAAPTANPINFTLTGLTSASTALKAAISAAIAGVFFENGVPGGTIDKSDIESAIAAVPGTAGFVITSPSGNIANPAGNLPTVGTVTYV